MVLHWLKQSQPLTKDLIQVWQEYYFMKYFESVWRSNQPIQITQQDWFRSQQILSLASPSLVRILQAVTLIHHNRPLLQVHLLLDLSWDELRIAIGRALGPCISHQNLLVTLFVVAQQSTTIAAHFNSLTLDLTSGALRVMQQIARGELPTWLK
ncbi:hypothetical protein C8R45DRAFT_302791 [Mycena sanguinolenta]|nr:hypothetical protein C8R45DRAFT_302791 [Mycena sanguinolenta]